ncbi:MAG: HPr family phosphocarrier protein [Hydrogenibacillus schlegelii]|uniref:Phosphocarrier protein HPr n=1 Tax=Hydrogenibacillus schlegelii TaxID=1484 RepID=A0A2T5GD41_HYDSH|nr:HPr family phosphocarrier protein [Hydrogenibacillus schlegelii]MBT9281082.1 HPr family phosphocarrier protein [Hydrogenibacillus schlegelii]PTQ54099.1 MAG: Catabolite repression HPr-like protein Crh [Hydrogenibacillus schlegelii]
MIERIVAVRLPNGLHARPAAQFVQAANRFKSEVTLVKGERMANAKSIMGVIGLGVAPGETVTLRVDGSDEDEAMEVLVRLLTRVDEETR